jgi:hypothetical protein
MGVEEVEPCAITAKVGHVGRALNPRSFDDLAASTAGNFRAVVRTFVTMKLNHR